MNWKKINTALVFVLIILSIVYLEARKPARPDTTGEGEVIGQTNAAKALQYAQAKELVNPSGFLNSEPFALKDLIGKKVILLDFWTYSCINCQRTLPYLNAWYEKYKDQGLEIIGVHTPEFEFEKDRENVARAIEKYGVKYPVVQDNDYATWSAYENRYWPREYLIDIDGYIVHDHIGEGGYEETEHLLQNLLKERMARLGESGTIATDMANPEKVIAVDSSQVESPETYFGAKRNANFGNGTPGEIGNQVFVLPKTIAKNQLYLVGNWDIQAEYAQAMTDETKIIFKYDAKNVYMVASANEPVVLRLIQDGKEVKTITVKEEDLYPLINNPDYGAHTLEIEVTGPGLKAFTLTFG